MTLNVKFTRRLIWIIIKITARQYTRHKSFEHNQILILRLVTVAWVHVVQNVVQNVVQTFLIQIDKM